MPKVPVYESTQVRSAALRAPDMSIQPRLIEQGAAISRTADQLAQQAWQISDREQERVASSTAQDALNQLSLARGQMLFGPEGYLSKKGKDALGDPNMMTEAFNKELAKLRAELPNEAARVLFDRSANQDRVQLELTVMKHFTEQQEAYAQENDIAGLRLAQSEAGLTGEVGPSMTKVDEIFKRVAERNGWAPDSDVYKDKLRQARSGVHAAKIDKMLEGDNPRYAEAKGYFDAIAGELDAATREDLEDKILPGAAEVGVNTYAAELFAKNPDDMDAALAQLKRDHIGSPDYDKRHAALLQQYDDKNRAERFEDAEWGKKVAENLGADGMIPDSIINSAPRRLRAEYRALNQKAQDDRLKRLSEDPEYQLKQALALADLKVWADENPELLAERNLPREWVQRGGDPKKLGEVANIQIDAAKRMRGGGKDGKPPKMIYSPETLVKMVMTENGTDPGAVAKGMKDWKPEDQRTYYRLLSELQSKVNGSQTELGEKEMRDFLNTRFVEVKFAVDRSGLKGWAFPGADVSRGKLATLSEEARENVFINKDEASSPTLWNFARVQAVAELRKNGENREPSEVEIGRFAWDIQSGDNAALSEQFRAMYPVPPEDEQTVTAILKKAGRADTMANRIDAWRRLQQKIAEGSR